eukprot:gb/GFBE01064328.1/.p1 GENE.gb/GFBE01064328.1/~~gb/GFBE01064328.1/.p1  ORF type:complete len:378 (+),score=62.94 gb/GFBE01064328.1/:1-1134(+)
MKHGRCLLELPSSALDQVAELLNLPAFFALRQASGTALNHSVLSAVEDGQLLPRPRCFITEGTSALDAASSSVETPASEPGRMAEAVLHRLHLPSLMVVVQRAPIKELMPLAGLVAAKAQQFRNLQVLYLVAPERHHLGDTCVRKLAAAVRTSLPALQTLGLPGINITRLASTALGEAVAVAPRLVRLDLHGAQITAAGWLHLLRQASAAPAKQPGCPKNLILGVSGKDPVPALRDMAKQAGDLWQVRVLPPVCSPMAKVNTGPVPNCQGLKWQELQEERWDDFGEGARTSQQPAASGALVARSMQTPRVNRRVPASSEPPPTLQCLSVLLRPLARPLVPAGRRSLVRRLRKPPVERRRCTSAPPAWPCSVRLPQQS